MRSVEQDDIPIPDLLANLSYEIGRLSGVAAHLDMLLSQVVASNPSASPDQLAGLQSVDALRQALDAITKITETAAKAVPEGCVCEVSRADLSRGVTIKAVLDACLTPASGGRRPPSDIAAALHVKDSDPAEIMFFDD